MNAPETSLKSYKSLQGLRVVAESGIQGEGRMHFIAPPPRVEQAGGATGHFLTYRPRPFTREERSSTTILFGGLHWRVERVIQGAMENLGYASRVLPAAYPSSLEAAKE